jgi:hypothetical protein
MSLFLFLKRSQLKCYLQYFTSHFTYNLDNFTNERVVTGRVSWEARVLKMKDAIMFAGFVSAGLILRGRGVLQLSTRMHLQPPQYDLHRCSTFEIPHLHTP